MIDIEDQVFNAVYPFIEPLVPVGCFTSEYTPTPAALPYAYLSEIDNVPDRKTADSGTHEWSCILTYEAQMFAYSKPEVKAIAMAMDEAMIGLMGFHKTQGQYIPNATDVNVYRYVARYERGVDRMGNLYRA